eukprot:3384313-Amphidinium_carterae.1
MSVLHVEAALFTHHQKAVCLDHDNRCVCFVGGIDLCDGRWDTPDHPLFRTASPESRNLGNKKARKRKEFPN